jgi:hypothetical protein
LVAALVAGGAVVLTPTTATAADVGYDCNGDVSTLGPGTRVSNDIAIKVNGVTYGRLNVGVLNYTGDGREHYVKYAVKDTRSDGLAPYVKASRGTTAGEQLGGSERVINRRGAASGWRCHIPHGNGHVIRISVRGSVADAPSIPEPIVVTLYYT